MDQPTSASEVRSFLGMDNFSCHFIPNYSSIAHPLRELKKKNQRVQWTMKCQESFEQLRDVLTEHCLNTYFDPDRSTKLIVDGSKKDGLGSMLTQLNPKTNEWEVIRYDSRPVTNTERHYSQLEIESAAIEWANRKNRIHLCGLPQYVISTDHKPLLPLYNSYRNELPPRVMKHKMNLHGYSYKLIHEPGESNPTDYMSRHPQCSTIPDWVNQGVKDTEWFINAVVDASLPDALTTEEIQEATEEDEQLQELVQAIKQGHISRKQDLKLKPFKQIFKELTVYDRMIVRGHKIDVPETLRQKAVKLAHESHQGLVKNKNYLRSIIWFPGMDSRRTDVVHKCKSCQVVGKQQHQNPLKMNQIPDAPWTNIRVDMYGPVHTGEYLLVVQF